MFVRFQSCAQRCDDFRALKKNTANNFAAETRAGGDLLKFLGICLWLATGFGAPSAELDLIPLPAKIEPSDGQFSANGRTVIVADSLFTGEAKLLAGQLHLHLAPAAAAGNNRIFLTTNNASSLGEEAYRLEINSHGATITASSPAGAFYGCQTLRQLIESDHGKIPFAKIEDAPRYAWRGLMLDVSRHFFDQATIFRLVDWMADYKLNRLHLHLTDDPAWRLEMKGYPGLTRAGARGNYSDSNAPAQFFTRAEMREIVKYAARRHIVIVPEIDLPGHAGAATRAYPELDGGAHTFNPARAETEDFLQNILLQTMELFPSPWIHLGGDEVNLSAWNHNPEVTRKLQSAGLKGTQELEAAVVNHMAGFIQAHGRIPAGWDEIVAGRPPAGAVIFWWRHNQPEMLEQALAGGYPVVLTPRSPCYFDYPEDPSYPETGWKLCNTPAAVYSGPVLPSEIPPAQRKQILGVEGCVWTEHIPTVPYLEFMIMPRLAALAEMAWTPDQRRDVISFNARLQPFLQQYRQAGIHFYDAANPAGSLQEARPLPEAGPKLTASGN